MRKIAMIIAMGVIFAGFAATSVAAEEYVVKKGDSLWNISQKYNTSVEDLVEVNGLQSTIIHPKQKLNLYATYTVEQGDTLTAISQEFDVTIEELKTWNELSSDLIVTGQDLKVKAPDNQTKQAEKPSTKDKKGTTKVDKKGTQTKEASKSASAPEGKTLTMTATAYTAECEGCTGITYTGVNLNENREAKVIAVDPNVIPLGTEVYVEGYGHATAADIGGAIKGNKIDIHLPTTEEALSWGVRTVNVTILDD